MTLYVNNLNTPAGVAKQSILQVVSSSTTNQVSSTSTTWVDTGLQATITPISASSRIFVYFSIPYTIGTNDRIFGAVQLLRGSTVVFADGNSQGMNINYYHNERQIMHKSWVDSPASTSALTYKVQMRRNDYSGSYDGTFATSYNSNRSNMILMEISS